MINKPPNDHLPQKGGEEKEARQMPTGTTRKSRAKRDGSGASTIQEMVEQVQKPKTERQKQEEGILEKLAEIGGLRVTDDDLTFQGRRLVIPETMSASDAIDYLDNYITQQEEEHRFDRAFRYRPWDGAHALQEALRKTFGTRGIGKATYSFFGKTPPELRTINIGPGETTQVPWGQVEMPLFKGKMHLAGVLDPEYGTLFRLVIDAPRKYQAHIEGLFRVVEEELKSNSIYKARAIDGQDMPEFLDLRGVTPDKVIYSDEVLVQMEANVWSLLKHSEAMRRLSMPLKRAVLLEGPYGTGKTLAAFLTAKVAEANGWTFVYCRPGKDNLDNVMSTARLYQPAVVFFEDVDTLADASGAQDQVTRLLDMFDGITAKGTELLAVLTTNHKERIHRGMVRPGRLDAMIHIGALDTSGVTRMIKAIVPWDLLSPDINYDEVSTAMEGFLPAFVKEAIDRTMRYGIARNGGEPQVLVTEDFVGAAHGLRPQLELMEGAEEGKVPPPLHQALDREISKTVTKVLTGTNVTEVGDEDNPVWTLVPTNGK